MEPDKSLINEVIESIKEKKGSNIVKLDIHEVTPISDFFIICTSGSDIQSRAIADEIIETLEEKEIDPFHIEGYESGKWILVDYIDFVVHIFLPRQREYYNLERLWGDVTREEFPDEE